MSDFVLSAASDDEFLAAAAQLGFVDEQGQLVCQGTLPDGSGDYFLTQPESLLVSTGQKVLGPGGQMFDEMVPDGRVYRGLRMNGNSPFEAGMPIPSQLTVYPMVRRLEDGSIDASYAPPPVCRIA
jgi:hypothetical protein